MNDQGSDNLDNLISQAEEQIKRLDAQNYALAQQKQAQHKLVWARTAQGQSAQGQSASVGSARSWSVGNLIEEIDVHKNKGICQESYDQGYQDGLQAKDGDRIT